MKKVFAVTTYLRDGSNNTYNILADNDKTAKKKAIEMEKRDYQDAKVDYPGFDYAEIKMICVIDE